MAINYCGGNVSQKHYIAIAAIIRGELDRLDGPDFFGDHRLVRRTLERVADQMAAQFKADNSRFQTERFMTACGF